MWTGLGGSSQSSCSCRWRLQIELDFFLYFGCFFCTVHNSAKELRVATANINHQSIKAIYWLHQSCVWVCECGKHLERAHLYLIVVLLIIILLCFLCCFLCFHFCVISILQLRGLYCRFRFHFRFRFLFLFRCLFHAINILNRFSLFSCIFLTLRFRICFLLSRFPFFLRFFCLCFNFNFLCFFSFFSFSFSFSFAFVAYSSCNIL